MPNGVRATIGFDTPGICPLSALSLETDERISGIMHGNSKNSSDSAVTEFTLDEPVDTPDNIEPIYSYSNGYRYRLTHTQRVDCPCEILGGHGCAPASYMANDGQLTIVFYATNYDHLQLIIGALRDNFASLDIKQLIQSSPESTESSEILIDIGNLTNRQLEVLQTAFEMGYFNRPRDANAEEVATALEIHPSTFNEHLASVQTKLFRNILRYNTEIQPPTSISPE